MGGPGQQREAPVNNGAGVEAGKSLWFQLSSGEMSWWLRKARTVVHPCLTCAVCISVCAQAFPRSGLPAWTVC